MESDGDMKGGGNQLWIINLKRHCSQLKMNIQW